MPETCFMAVSFIANRRFAYLLWLPKICVRPARPAAPNLSRCVTHPRFGQGRKLSTWVEFQNPRFNLVRPGSTWYPFESKLVPELGQYVSEFDSVKTVWKLSKISIKRIFRRFHTIWKLRFRTFKRLKHYWKWILVAKVINVLSKVLFRFVELGSFSFFLGGH